MNQSNTESLLAQLTQMQFNQNVQQCWKDLAAGVELRSMDIHEQSLQGDKALTPFSAWWHSCCELIAGRQVVISNVDYKALVSGVEADPYIELHNKGPMIIDLGSWRVNVGGVDKEVIFPKYTYIKPGDTIRIYTSKKGAFSFNSHIPIWNNQGDIAYLYDQNSQLVSTWCYGKPAHDLVFISDIFYDGIEKHTGGDEYAVITNKSEHWIDLSSWQLMAGNEQQFTFPAGSAVAPYSSVRVYTNHFEPCTGGYSFESKTAVWNDEGDTGKLADSFGHVVSQYSYTQAK